jgi:transcriptional regulator with XRE-family HTH domain
MTEKNIAERIKAIRKHLQFKQEIVANLTHTTTQTLSRYEKGTRFPDSHFLEKFGKAFKVNANWLLYGKGDMFLQNPEELEIINDRQKMLSYLFDKVKKIFEQLNK